MISKNTEVHYTDQTQDVVRLITRMIRSLRRYKLLLLVASVDSPYCNGFLTA